MGKTTSFYNKRRSMASAWIAIFLVAAFVDDVQSAESSPSLFRSSPTSSSSSLMPSPSPVLSSSISKSPNLSFSPPLTPPVPAQRSSSSSSSSSSLLSSSSTSSSPTSSSSSSSSSLSSLSVLSTSASTTASVSATSRSLSSPTQPADVSFVDVESIGSTGATLTLAKKEFLRNGHKTSYVQVIVIQLKEGQNLEVSTHEKYSEANIYRDYKAQVKGEPYITAEFNYGTLKKFRIGDEEYYSRSVQRQRRAIGSREYYNGELEEGANYAVFQRSFDDYGSYESESFIRFTTTKSSRTAVIIVSVVLVVPLLLILLVFAVNAGCKYISKGQKTKRKPKSGTRRKAGHKLIAGKETVGKRLSEIFQENQEETRGLAEEENP